MSLFRNGGRTATQLRGFSSSSSLRVGPESPNFIEVPKPIQPSLPQKPRVRGTLPVPREIFPRRRVDKPGKQYIADATPVSQQKEIKKNDPHADLKIWKRDMAEMRRRNFEEGLLELYGRKRKNEKKMQEKSAERQALREQVFRQRERPDEEFTRPSIPQELVEKRKAGLPDPGREERLAASQLRIENRNRMKEMERQDSLHTLYVNARNFITTEAQLAAEIEKVFPEGPNEAWINDQKYGDNVWNLGFPRGMNLRLNDTANRRETERWDIIQGRVKQLGEQITGGKI
ncbi:hypothetical protein BDV18DRAFT_29005 [Aspergillus unguis]